MTDDSGTVNVQPEQVTNYRIQDILSTRRNARKVRRTLKQNRRHDDQDGCAQYRAVLEAHLEETYPLLVKFERGEHYWEEEEFGLMTLEPDEQGVRGAPQRQYPLTGLKALFELPDPVTAEFSLTRKVGSRYRHEPVTVFAQPSFEHLDKMFFATSRFMSEIGLTLDELAEAQTIGNISIGKETEVNDAGHAH